MAHSEKEIGVALVLLKRLVDERLPRLLEIKSRVDSGELLAEFDIHYLEQAFQDANQNHHLVIGAPEYTDLVGRIAQLYKEITSKALENERAQK